MRLTPLHGAGLCLLLLPSVAESQDGRTLSVLIPRIGLRVNLPIDILAEIPGRMPAERRSTTRTNTLPPGLWVRKDFANTRA